MKNKSKIRYCPIKTNLLLLQFEKSKKLNIRTEFFYKESSLFFFNNCFKNVINYLNEVVIKLNKKIKISKTKKNITKFFNNTN